MNKAVQITCLAAIAAICLTTAALAQTSVTLTGPPPGYVYDGIYMSPYYATVGGVTNTPIVCDDFGDDSNSGSTWNATVTSFSNITSTNTSWGSTAASNTKLYGAAGYLFGQILSASTPYDKVVDTFELWALFDPGAVKNYLASTSVGAGSPISTSALSNLIFGTASNPGGLLASLLQQNFSASAYSNLIILSPDNGNGTICAAGQGNCAAQEFITFSVPEGGAGVTYLLLAGFCCVGAMWVRLRSTRSRIVA
jgi:hypothetical protein